MKLWRKIRSEDGASVLEEVTSIDAIDTDKPVLLILPAMTCKSGSRKMGKVAGGSIKHVERMLGTTPDDPEAEILCVSYDEPTHPLVSYRMNRKMDGYHNGDAAELAEKFLKPLQDKGVHPTLYTVSYGSVVADNARARLIDRYSGAGLNEREIAQKLENICLIAVSNISNAINPDAPNRNSGLDYTSVYFSFANDRASKAVNPAHKDSIRPHYRKGDYAVSRLPGNRLLVMAQAPGKIRVQDAQGTKIITGRKAKTAYFPLHHSSLLAVHSGEAKVPLLAPLVERSLRHAVRREGRTEVRELLGEPAETLATQPDGTMRASEEQEAIMQEALRNTQHWRSRIATGQAAAGKGYGR